MITLIKEEVEDADIGKYTTANPKGMKRDDLPETARKKTSGFSQGTAFTGDSKVHLCLSHDGHIFALSGYLFLWCSVPSVGRKSMQLSS